MARDLIKNHSSLVISRYERLNSWLRGDVGSGNVKEESEAENISQKKN